MINPSSDLLGPWDIARRRPDTRNLHQVNRNPFFSRFARIGGQDARGSGKSLE